MAKPARILIADDSRLVREGLSQLIAMPPDLMIVGEAENGEDALRQVRSLTPDIVILDIEMPHLSGLEALPWIRESSPSTAVIILSMHDLSHYVEQALRSGAAGYLLKTADVGRVLEAISAVRRGKTYISPQLRKEQTSLAGADLQSELPALS